MVKMTDTTTSTTLKNDWVWLCQHLLLLGVFFGIVCAAIYFIDSLIAKHDSQNLKQYESILKNQESQTQALRNQLSEMTSENAVRDAQYQKTLAQLAQNIVQRDANAQVQKKVDNTLDAAATAQRIALQTKAAPPQVTVQGNNVVLDLPIARAIVSDLDTLPVVQGDLADTKKELVAQQGLSNDATQALAKANDLIDSQNLQIWDASKTCNAQITVLKAEARKSKLRWFGVGFIAGFITGVATHGF
jgi:hypothetical protein